MNAAQASRLREVLLDPLEAAKIEVAGSATGAVLVALYERDGELYVVLTKRREALPRHAGQISFPGGRRDATDAALSDTAVREAWEEIGLEPSAVTILGALTPISVPASGFALYPFVGAIERPDSWTIAELEVETILEVSLPDLARNYVKRTLAWTNHTAKMDTYNVDGHLIWGATARVLSDLLSRLGLLGES